MNTKHNAHPPLRQDIVESAKNCNDPVLTAHVLETSRDCGIAVDKTHRRILNGIIAQKPPTQSWFERFASF